jgi:hypothetical protein
MSKSTSPRVESDVCARCRKKFREGDRLTQAFIVERTGLNPNNLRDPGVFLSAEFELVHIRCEDADLSKGPLGGA